MRALLPADPGEINVHEWYARNWVDAGGLRVNFVTSVDGGVTADGLSRGLQTPGDNRVFAALRDLADVVLAGAGTVRAEKYRAVTVTPARQEIRRRYGFAPDALPVAVVSASLRLQPDAPLFHDDHPERTIVITTGAADPGARRALATVADVIVAGDDHVDLAAARAALENRGLRRILCEGGPTLFADLARAGVADELCLSVSPLLAGPGVRHIVAGDPWTTGAVPLRLTGLLEEDAALFARYAIGTVTA